MRRIVILLLITILLSIGAATAKNQHLQEHSQNVPLADKRNSLPLPQALLGHWVMESGRSHYFFNEGYFISVYKGRTHTTNFTIVEVDEIKRKLRLKLTDAHFLNVIFSADKRQVLNRSEFIGGKIEGGEPFYYMAAETPYTWNYVDDSLKPSAELIQSTITGEPTFELKPLPETPKFIRGDRKTKIYYWDGCPDYDKVPLERRDYFRTRKEAQREGYRAAKNC